MSQWKKHLMHEWKINGESEKKKFKGNCIEKEKEKEKIGIERENWNNITEQKISKVDEETKVLLKMC